MISLFPTVNPSVVCSSAFDGGFGNSIMRRGFMASILKCKESLKPALSTCEEVSRTSRRNLKVMPTIYLDPSVSA